MATLDTIKQLKSSGYSESDIIKSLQDRGIPPRDINEALSQSKIKEAVESPDGIIDETSGMEPSLISQDNEYPDNQFQYKPQQNQTGYNPQIPPQSEFEPPEEYTNQFTSTNTYPQEQYPDYQQMYGLNAETMNEIASQLITEKLSKTNKSISTLNEFKILIDGKVEKIDQRLQRIELIIDQLQTNLIRKSNDQVQNIEDIKNEIKGMQTSFSKVINPLVDVAREARESKGKNITKR